MGRILKLLTAQGLHFAQEHKRQVLALDSEFEQMEAQITSLKSENQHLQAKVHPLQREVDQLKSQIQRMEASAAAASRKPLEEKAEKLLLAIANRSDFPDTNVPATLGCTRAEANYYLGVLKKRFYISSRRSYTDPDMHNAKQSGLEYLHERGLL